MKRVTQEDIIKINKAYKACGTYSGAAAATGWSASTVKKYIIADFNDEERLDGETIELPSLEAAVAALSGTHITLLTAKELSGLKEIWKEMIV